MYKTVVYVNLLVHVHCITYPLANHILCMVLKSLCLKLFYIHCIHINLQIYTIIAEIYCYEFPNNMILLLAIPGLRYQMFLQPRKGGSTLVLLQQLIDLTL